MSAVSGSLPASGQRGGVPDAELHLINGWRFDPYVTERLYYPDRGVQFVAHSNAVTPSLTSREVLLTWFKQHG
jgi:hypothetical protein